ncbi:MAG: formate--tetrahydrofolate ligase [Rikenellaceae bacterium]
MNKDLEIAQQVEIEPIVSIAEKLGINADDVELYGRYKAKLPLDLIDPEKMAKSNLILVSAISPTPAGEGKTTVSIGLTQALNKIGKKSVAVLREPSLGPVFGMKGGAAGGGWSQVIPMLDINLHFTGDFAAVEAANNLLAAMIDNNLQAKKGNLGIDPRTIKFKRVIDVNDRALRNINIGLGGVAFGVPRESGFNITPASEIMAILCMAKDITDLKERLGNIFVGYTYDKRAIFARDLKAHGAMTVLLRDAIKPNLVQTLEHTPAIIHGGPFANIAQGTNTIISTKMGLSLSDYVVTEGGFGFDLGGEKFLNIKCREMGIAPKVILLVATLKAIKYHGGVALEDLAQQNIEALEKGIGNLEKHLENIRKFGVTPIIAINRYVQDSEQEIEWLEAHCQKLGVEISLCEVWAKGGEGGIDLAEKVVRIIEKADPCAKLNKIYNVEDDIKTKIRTLAREIYGADDVAFTPNATREIKKIEALGFGGLPLCMAKTQKSLSDIASKLGRPSGFVMNVRDIELASGAGFVVPIAGDILRMPGLPAVPAAESIDIDEAGHALGVF